MTVKIGWIGLGHMGLPMATNLYKAGYDVKVWNRSLGKAIESGLPYVESLEDLLEDRDVIITMLFDSSSVEEVYQKIINSGKSIKGKVFIDMTTIYPETAKRIAEMLIKEGAEFLEAPVIGSVIPAEKGLLTIVVSGDKEIFERYYDIFSVLGKQIFYLGDYGMASTMKLVNNTVLGNFLSSLCEALVLAEKSGISRKMALSVLANGAGKSMILDAKMEKLLNEDYQTHFSVNLIHKDLSYAVDLAQEVKVPIVITSTSHQLYNGARAYNLGDLDFSAVLEVYKKLSNLS
ncbi:MAG: NAD(P)-dependent oxidoreductase [Aquificae bacterium]|nr:NAD(P)-dependent oxidoreductase [Aquificota bacterium]